METAKEMHTSIKCDVCSIVAENSHELMTHKENLDAKPNIPEYQCTSCSSIF